MIITVAGQFKVVNWTPLWTVRNEHRLVFEEVLQRENLNEINK